MQNCEIHFDEIRRPEPTFDLLFIILDFLSVTNTYVIRAGRTYVQQAFDSYFVFVFVLYRFVCVFLSVFMYCSRQQIVTC